MPKNKNDDTPEQDLPINLDNLPEMDDETLQGTIDQLMARSEELLAGDDITPEELEELEAVADALDAVRAEQGTRAEAAEARAEKVNDLLDRINPPAEDDEGEGDPADPEAAATDPEGDEPPADEEGDDAQPDPVVDDTAPETEDAAAPEAEPEKEPVAASSKPRISKVAARRPGIHKPQQAPAPPVDPGDVAKWGLVASANNTHVPAGTVINDAEQLAMSLITAWETSEAYRGPRSKFRAAQAKHSLSKDDPRYLGDSATQNFQKIQAVSGRHAVAASGGICAPHEVEYGIPTRGSSARPIKDGAMAGFTADRGGIEIMQPPVLADVEEGVVVWTEANDQSPSSPATKPCVEMTCPTPETKRVDAVTKCLEIGEFRSRFFPEQVEAWLRKLQIQHSREAEQNLITALDAGSTQVESGEVLGASRDILTGLHQALWGIASYHRYDDSVTYRFVAPTALKHMMIVDLIREVPGSAEERLATTEAKIEALLAAAGVNVTWTNDLHVQSGQGDGPMSGFPNTVTTYLYPEGEWLHLDGGELNVGIVRDSDLVGTNNYRMFAEVFEQAQHHGDESWEITFDVCANGATAASSVIAPCVAGS